jgi:hypothetical protein
MTTENELGRPYETCWRCGKESPPHIEGPEGAAAQGWVSVEEGDEDDIGVYCPPAMASRWVAPSPTSRPLSRPSNAATPESPSPCGLSA